MLPKRATGATVKAKSRMLKRNAAPVPGTLSWGRIYFTS
jgi:hypothetical protein